jgi:hypothetical protein
MKLLTANRLSDGVVLWLGAEGWSEDAALALKLSDEDADSVLAVWKVRETEVVAPYLIPLLDDETKPVKREWVREYVRANGPTIGQTVLDTAKTLNRSEVF